jgi:hypothetical protein
MNLDGTWIAGAVIVLALVAARLQYGRVTSVNWQPIRRRLTPVINAVAKRYLGEDWYATSRRVREEHVATLNLHPRQVIADLEAVGYEDQPLASHSVDWTGRPEAASMCRYIGLKPYPGAPYWLRKRQVHVRVFETGAGRSVLTAHAETNPWRFWEWRDHYQSESLDIQAGRMLVASDLAIEPESLSETHAS